MFIQHHKHFAAILPFLTNLQRFKPKIMNDFKLEAAKASLAFIKSGQIIGLGAGTTIFHLIDTIVQNSTLAASLTFVSSSFKTTNYLNERQLRIATTALIDSVDIYLDGCDQFDKELNALKSGGGIHTREKILASMAKEFILMGDESKSMASLDHTYPLVIEILPEALSIVKSRLFNNYPDASFNLRLSTQKDGAVITENGNLLADLYFTKLPDLAELNVSIKMIPGVVEHSLFYKMATKAVIAGITGIKILES
jgi:ribose 5-phosphate isomerase A